MEDLDITDYVDESGNIILKKLIFALKNDYNFPLESKCIFIGLRQGNTLLSKRGRHLHELWP